MEHLEGEQSPWKERVLRHRQRWRRHNGLVGGATPRRRLLALFATGSTVRSLRRSGGVPEVARGFGCRVADLVPSGVGSCLPRATLDGCRRRVEPGCSSSSPSGGGGRAALLVWLGFGRAACAAVTWGSASCRPEHHRIVAAAHCAVSSEAARFPIRRARVVTPALPGSSVVSQQRHGGNGPQ